MYKTTHTISYVVLTSIFFFFFNSSLKNINLRKNSQKSNCTAFNWIDKLFEKIHFNPKSITDKHMIFAHEKKKGDKAGGTRVKAILDLGAETPSYVGLEPSQEFKKVVRFAQMSFVMLSFALSSLFQLLKFIYD